MRYIVFYVPLVDDSGTGEIDSIDEFDDDTVDADIDAAAPDGCDWVEADADPTKDYILDGVVTERPTIDAEDVYHIDADGEEQTLFVLPDGTDVTYDADVLTADGEEDFVVQASRSGQFEFLIEPPFPYLPTTVTVIADAV